MRGQVMKEEKKCTNCDNSKNQCYIIIQTKWLLDVTTATWTATWLLSTFRERFRCYVPATLSPQRLRGNVLETVLNTWTPTLNYTVPVHVPFHVECYTGNVEFNVVVHVGIVIWGFIKLSCFDGEKIIK